MATRVEVAPHLVLRLVLGKGGTAFHDVCTGGREIVDLDVEVHHHLLLARPRRSWMSSL